MGKKDLSNLEYIDKESPEYQSAIQELVSVIKATDHLNTSKTELLDDISDFVKNRSLKTGTREIPVFLIYADYYVWSDEQPKYSLDAFAKKLFKRFHSKRRSYGRVVLVSKDNYSDYATFTLKEIKDLKKYWQDQGIFKKESQDETSEEKDS